MKFILTKAQETIRELNAGRHLILAPPGAGKTQLLALRVPAALENGVSPEDMLCITFTNRAARNMISRISSLEQIEPERLPFIGTLHNFALRFLYENSLIPSNAILLDQEDARILIKEAFNAVVARVEVKDAENIGDRILANYLKLYAQKKYDLGAYASPFYEDELLSQVGEEYQRLKSGFCAIDFDDTLYITLHNLLHNRKLAEKKYDWVQIDEAQDLSALQWGIISQLLSKGAHVLYFADFAQSIYSFLGASKEELLKHTKGAKIHHLQENFRSPKKLIQFYNRYVKYNFTGEVNVMQAVNSGQAFRSQNIRKIKTMGDFEQEAEIIADKLLPGLEKQYKTTAILVHTNHEAEIISKALDAKKLRHFRVSGFDLFQRKEIKDVMAFLRARKYPYDRYAWTRLLALFGRVGTLRESRKIINALFEARTSPECWLQETGHIPDYDKLASLYGKRRMVIFDTETTGLSVVEDDIVQIAAVEICSEGSVGREFEVFLKTDKDLTESSKIHQLSREFIEENGIDAAEGLRQFMEFIGDDILIGHNVNYDVSILKNNLRRRGISWTEKNPIYDSLSISRRLFPRLKSYKLSKLLEHLKLEGENTHNALDDVRATVNLLRRLIDEARESMVQRRAVEDRYASILHRFSQSLTPLWDSVTERLEEETNLKEIIREFYNYCYKELHHSFNAESKLQIRKLMHYLENNTPRRPLRNLLDNYLPELITYSEADLLTGGEPIVVSTVHKAKGLEFDAVIVAGCNDDNYPGFYAKKDGDGERIKEDARVLYVALTRARESLIITYHSQERYGEVHPSPFIAFMGSRE